MSDHPAFRSFVAAVALVAALGGLALTAARPLIASLEGSVLMLAQPLRTAGGARVAWIDTGEAPDATVDRGLLASAIERVRAYGPRAIVIAEPLTGPGGSADLKRVREFLESREAAADPALRARLQSWAAELDHDARLEAAIRRAGNVVLIARVDESASRDGAPKGPLRWPRLGSDDLAADPPLSAPLERFARVARSVGADSALPPQADGVSRVYALLAGDESGAVPSAPAAAWLAARNARAADATWDRGVLAVGSIDLAVASDGTWVPWYGSREDAAARHGWPIDDVVAGRAPAQAFAGHIVVFGPGRELVTTPAGRMPAAQALARRIASLEAGSYAVRPTWSALPLALLLLLAPVMAVVAGARLPPARRFLLAGVAAAAVLAAGFVLLLTAGLWIPLVTTSLAFPVAMLGTLVPTLRPRERSVPVPRTVSPVPTVPVGRSVRPKPSRPVPVPASDADGPSDATRPMPSRGAAETAAAAVSPQSLREINEQLRARQEEPSRADVADLLLGRTKRPPKPRLGRYELERELGRGAMGTVYLGRDPRINRVVAVKAIPLAQEFEGTALQEARDRFFREAEMAGRLKHPSIVTVYDAGEDGGIAYIAMEYVRGRLLSEHATSDALLPAAQVLEIVARIGDALDYAHAQDIVHRDIKPSNVIFDPATLDTKITDFGIARLTNSSATRSGIVLGTPSFMAPEQLEGRTVNGRSDLFSLGVTLFQLLAGQLPFRADSMTGLMDKIANAPHPPLRTIRPDLPPCVGLIVDRALQKDPARRFVTGAEMARALRACARSLAA
jgi:serine/threonine-protein kinase